MSEEKIIARIQKMLALANDSAATEGERDNALRMSYKLLALHNLELGDIEKHTREADDPRIDHGFDSWSQVWAKDIFHAVGKLFFCRYHYGYKINATKVRHHYVGRSSNATTAALIAQYVVTSVLREARKRYTHNLSPESRAFGIGAASRIWSRVRELQAKDLPDAAPGTALVLADIARVEDTANAEFLAGYAIKVAKRRETEFDPRAYRAGHEFGGKVSLSPQVEAEAETLRLQRVDKLAELKAALDKASAAGDAAEVARLALEVKILADALAPAVV